MLNKAKLKNKILSVFTMFVLAVMMFVGYSSVYADGGSGTGGGGGADSTKNCSNAQYTNLNKCPSPNEDVGGASWHIFRTDDNVWTNYKLYKNGPHYCATNSGYNVSNGDCVRPLGLKNASTVYDRQLSDQCPKSTYSYYYAFVYDGWNGVGIKNKITLWGPLAHDAIIDNKKIPRNNTGAMSESTLYTKLSSGADLHKQKVNESAVASACRYVNSGSCKSYSSTSGTLPKNLGYVCAANLVTLDAKARDTAGNFLNDGKIIDTSTANLPLGTSKAKVTVTASKYKPEGYKFVGWRDKSDINSAFIKGNEGDPESITFEISKYKVVHAYYEKDENIFKLDAKAIDKSTGEFMNGGRPIDTAVANRSSGATKADLTVTSNNYKPAGYRFVGWKITNGPNAEIVSTNQGLTVEVTGYRVVHAYYEKGGSEPQYQSATLTADAYTDGGTLIGKAISSDTIQIPLGGSGNATVQKKDYSGYSFLGWSDTSSVPSTFGNTGANYTKNIKANTTVYAFYGKNTFEGQSKVTGAASVTAGFSTSSVEQYGFINNCPSATGCEVTFEHNLKRTKGSGTTKYYIERTSNLTTTSKKISSGTLRSSTVWGSGKANNASDKVYSDGPLKLYPGMVVCEILSFEPYNDGTSKIVKTKVCVAALGNAQPDDPSNLDEPEDPRAPSENGNDAFINIKVRNTRVTKYEKYQRAVYAKPGDTLEYRSIYNPRLQYTYYLIPQMIQIDKGTMFSNGASIKKLGEMFNDNYASFDWNNAYGVQFGTNVDNVKYSPGDDTRKAINPASIVVSNSDVGKRIDKKAITSVNKDTKTTPSQVEFRKGSGNYVVGNVVTASRESTTYAYVPYNFIIRGEIVDSNSDDDDDAPAILNAGESASVNIDIIVDKKENSETTNNPSEEKYATDVDDAQYEIIVYDPNKVGGKKDSVTLPGGRSADICSSYFNSSNGADCNSSEIKTTDLTAGNNGRTDNGFVVKDQPAGSELCVALAVFPASSGADTNWNDTNYDSRWFVSESKCYIIGKKPSMQIVGGNIYSGGQIKTGLSVKRHLLGYSDYWVNLNNSDKPYVFGSWGELGVISSGVVNGFASGASLGYAGFIRDGNNKLSLYPNQSGGNEKVAELGPGGSRASGSDKLCVLTIGNCVNSSQSNVGGTSNKNVLNGIDNDRKTLELFVKKFRGDGNTEEVGDTLEIGESATNYYHSSGDLTLGSVNGLGNGVVKVVDADGSITIGANIEYMDGNYANLENVPKLIIYSAERIEIDCKVNRIDAVLVANVVRTCNSDNINSRNNSNQLIVNGAIIANTLIPNRTYGAGPGVESIVPAEIINFDPSLYAWGDISIDSGGYNNDIIDDLDVTYVHELAPRY